MKNPAHNFIDLTGLKFNRLLVLERVENKVPRVARWLCLCDCGNTKVINGRYIRKGRTKSCGCYSVEITKQTLTIHGHAANGKTDEYKIYLGLLRRCYNNNSTVFKHYGGRGITVCDRWMEGFQNFLDDMGERPSINHSIDRIDNNNGYSKENCKWATPTEQARNKSSNRLLTHNGETFCISEWSEILGIQADTITARLNRSGWTIEKALTTPVKRTAKALYADHK